MKTAVIVVCILGLIGCSEGDTSTSISSSDLSSKECKDIGGKLVDGMGCIKDIPESEMRKMCENNQMEYSIEFNGCIE